MVSSVLQAVYGLVDMLIVSHMIGDAGASGVNNAAQAMHLITQISIGLSNGGNILVGQYFGRGDDKNRRETIGTFFSMFAILGVLVSIVSFIFAEPFLRFMGAPAFDEALAYLRVCTLGLVFVFGYNALASVLRAMGNSKAPLYFIFVSTVTNIGLDLLFVGPLGMETAGAALATVISQGFAFIFALIYMLRAKEIFVFSLSALKIRIEKVRLILRVGIPSAVQMTVASISWLTVTYLINDYGTIWSAANGFSGKIKDFLLMFINAMSTATASMIAQNLGAKEFERAKKTMYTAMKLTVAMSIVVIILVEPLAPALMAIFTKTQEVIDAGTLNLRIEIISQVFYAVFLIYHSLMLGAGDTWWVLISSFANCIVFRLVFAITFNYFWGINGVFVACMIAPTISIPVGMYYFKRGSWRKSLAEKHAV